MKNVYCCLKENNENEILLASLNKEGFKLVDIEKCDEKVSVIVNDSFTKLATVLLNNWKLKEKIEEIILIGGTTKYGDVTPVAEKNIYDDVFSAQQIFISNIPIVMFGLNVSRSLENRALLALAYLKHESFIEYEKCGVYIETKGEKTKGMCVTDLYSDSQFKDHDVNLAINVQKEKYLEFVKKYC